MKTKLVNLVSCHYYKALLLKSYLEDAGIESYLANMNLIQSDIASGVKVLVKDSDIGNALQILHDVDKTYGQEDDLIKKKVLRFNKIICPVDFSPDSINAAHYAILLAAKIEAEIKFVHAYNPIQPFANVFPDAFSYQIDMGNIYRDELLISKQKVQQFKKDIKDYIVKNVDSKVKFSSHLIANDPFNGIPAFCNKFKSAMIIMGTKGLGKSKSYMTGSVALRTIENVKIPVMVIPAKYNVTPLDNFNLIYLTDFDEKDFSSFRKLMSIAGIFNPTIHCIHLEQEKNKINQLMLNELVRELKAKYSHFDVDCTIIKGHDASKGINAFIKANNINLIAMSDRKRGFLLQIFSKSIIRDMLFNINIPLLIFKY